MSSPEPTQAAPRSSLRAIALQATPRRITAIAAVCMLSLSTVAWVLNIQEFSSSESGDMGMGMSRTGPYVLLFLGMWFVMIVAMMFPVATPMIAAHWFVSRRLGRSGTLTVAFVLGYVTIWLLAGTAPLAVYLTVGSVDPMGIAAFPAALTGGTFIAAGLYELLPLKRYCLIKCRSPLRFVLSYDFGGHAWQASAAGVLHGLYCIGCCGAMLALLTVVGIMNLAWMASLTVLLLAERVWRHGAKLSGITGSALFVGGLMVVCGIIPISLIG